MTKAFIERVKKELIVYTQRYIYYGGYWRHRFVISRTTLDGKKCKVVYTERASYAEIVKIVKAVKFEGQEPQHPFKVGDVFTAKVWTGDNYEKKEFTVTKITADKVTTKCGDARATTRKPRRCPYDNNVWALSLGDDTVYKKAE